MRLIPRLLAVAVMLAAMFLLIRHVRELQAAGEVEISKLVTYYFAILGLAASTALVTCISLLPLLGEFAGNFMFAPNEQIERSPHADALARLAAGDFQGAIDAYKKVFEENPQDTHAASEIVHLYCDKLNNPEPAADFLVEALSYADRTPEETAFLSQRLVDVCWGHLRDGIRARAILIKIAEDMPETREAANALHRLQEIDRAMSEEAYLAQHAVETAPAVGEEAATKPAVAEAEAAAALPQEEGEKQA